jgi:hypothetical protein
MWDDMAVVAIEDLLLRKFRKLERQSDEIYILGVDIVWCGEHDFQWTRYSAAKPPQVLKLKNLVNRCSFNVYTSWKDVKLGIDNPSDHKG